MKKLLHKELRLTAAPITYLFLAFALMTLIPGYPILMGGFFITLGIFYTFQTARESGDILFTALLPCKKKRCRPGKIRLLPAHRAFRLAALCPPHRPAAHPLAGSARLHPQRHDERQFRLSRLAFVPLCHL